MYSTIVVAEALGSTNNSQVLDLFANGDNAMTPGYAIYENDALARMVLINYMTEQDGQGSYTATISVGGGDTGEPNGTPSSVQVKWVSRRSMV